MKVYFGKTLSKMAQETVDVEKKLGLSIDEALSAAMEQSVDGTLSSAVYDELLGKLGEDERDAFTLGLASNNIKVLPENETMQVQEPDNLRSMQEKISKLFATHGYLDEDEYMNVCAKSNARTVGDLNTWLLASRIPLKKKTFPQKRKVTKPITDEYKQKVTDMVKHPNVNKFPVPKMASMHLNKVIEELKEDTEDEFLPTWDKWQDSKRAAVEEKAQYLDSEKEELAETVRKRQDQIPNWKQLLQKIQKVMDFSELREIWDSLKEVPAFASKASEYKTATIASDDATFSVFVAETQEQLTDGLQGFDTLDKGAGMLFQFDEPQHVTFHMGSVKFPIDIMFLLSDEAGNMRVKKIVSNATPGTKDVWSNEATDVLELNGGSCKEYKIAVGDLLKLS